MTDRVLIVDDDAAVCEHSVNVKDEKFHLCKGFPGHLRSFLKKSGPLRGRFPKKGRFREKAARHGVSTLMGALNQPMDLFEQGQKRPYLVEG